MYARPPIECTTRVVPTPAASTSPTTIMGTTAPANLLSLPRAVTASRFPSSSVAQDERTPHLSNLSGSGRPRLPSPRSDFSLHHAVFVVFTCILSPSSIALLEATRTLTSSLSSVYLLLVAGLCPNRGHRSDIRAGACTKSCAVATDTYQTRLHNMHDRHTPPELRPPYNVPMALEESLTRTRGLGPEPARSRNRKAVEDSKTYTL